MPGDNSQSDAAAALKHQLRAERKQITLLKRPFTTLYYFVLELGVQLWRLTQWLLSRWLSSLAVLTLFGAFYYTLHTSEDDRVQWLNATLHEGAYWIILGVLSSVGLGTGLHTFVLFLGPYIAQVTIHAYACGTFDFLSQMDVYNRDTWDDVVCATPEDGVLDVSVWSVIAAVRFAFMCWGLGTAMGELPPYFVARAARLTEDELDDEDLEEFHDTLKSDDQQILMRLKRYVHNLVQKWKFWGIFLCASIPNPLFDLAGITCGHFLIPFWTFFAATALGKAVVKVHLQVFFIVAIMSKPVFTSIVKTLDGISTVGPMLAKALANARASAEAKFSDEAPAEEETNYFSMALAAFVIAMILYFVLSIVTQMAQGYRHRLDTARVQKETKSK
eukprot:m.356443 g.356443  ORF g.356443 m.356443 type:complete len:389 (+) comp17544_c0_seq1:188-1354(+)